MKTAMASGMILAALLAACPGGATSGGNGESAVLQSLTELEQLTAAFNKGQGKPRVVLLLSPT